MADKPISRKPAGAHKPGTKKPLTPEQRQKLAARKGAPGNPAKRGQPQPGGKPQPDRNKVKQPQDVSMIHGAEALAALTVSESKLSRFKSRGILGLLKKCNKKGKKIEIKATDGKS